MSASRIGWLMMRLIRCFFPRSTNDEKTPATPMVSAMDEKSSDRRRDGRKPVAFSPEPDQYDSLGRQAAPNERRSRLVDTHNRE